MTYSTIIVLRILHVAFGAFRVGGAITVGFFFLPRSKRPAQWVASSSPT